MALKITEAVAASTVSAVTAAVDAGEEGSAQLIIFEGEVPESAASPVDLASKILVTFDLPNPAFGAPMLIDNVVEALAYELDPVSASEAGEAQFFRIYDCDGEVVMQGAVGEGMTDLVLNQNNITEGADVTVQRLVVGMDLG